MANEQRTIYIGVTNNLEGRVWEHKHPARGSRSFTKRYRLTKLVYAEEFDNPNDAIAWEKHLKGWKRNRKIELIHVENPDWLDLAGDWFESAEAR